MGMRNTGLPRLMTAVLVAPVLIGIISCGSQPSPEPTPVVDDQLVPGVSIGLVKVGDRFGDVTSALGTPAKIVPSLTQWTVMFFYPDRGISGAVDDTDQDEQADTAETIEMVVASAPFSGTYQGVGLGSFRDEVLQVMGPVEEIDGSTYWYWTLGIAWDIELGTVTMITVFNPIDEATTRSASRSSGSRPELKQRFRALREEPGNLQ